MASATVAVEKATSDLLMGPDWTMNIEICDSVNTNRWQPKDVVKAVKKRLQHKSPKVQLLSLTLLETVVKNCGEHVHFQIAEKNILDEMIKIVRKKTDMQVRDKVLVLIDSWQEAFGGPGGKHPHYYWAFEELKRSGVVFPKRSPDAAAIFTPPAAQIASRNMQAGYGMPNNSSKRLDETMATETESLSLSSLDSMRHVMELLSDMLQAVNPNDRAAVKDEVIVDLVDRCRANQKKLMQMLTTTGDEELLGRGLELNDNIQSLLAKHDAIASGSPLPSHHASSSSSSPLPSYHASSSAQSSEACSSSINPTEDKSSVPGGTDQTLKPNSSTLVPTKGQIDEEEEEEDEFAQLARRHSKGKSVTNGSSATTETNSPTSDPTASIPINALAIVDQPAPTSTSKEQDIIDLLSITLSPSPPPPSSSQIPPPPSASSQQADTSVPSSTQGYPNAPQYPGNVPLSSYVVPWAQPESKSESQPRPQQHIYGQQPTPQQLHPQHEQQHFKSQPSLHPQQLQFHNQHLNYPRHEPQQFQSPHQHQPQPQFQSQSQAQAQPQFQSQTQPIQMIQPRPQSQLQNQHAQYPSSYPPPPWAATPGYPTNQNHLSSPNMFMTPQANTSASYRPAQGTWALQNNNSFSSRGTGGTLTGDPKGNSGMGSNTNSTGQKPFVPSYRLFEDLNVFGNTDGRIKMTSGSSSSSLSGTMGPGMVGGRK